MVKLTKKEKKNVYMAKLITLVESKPQCLIVEVDNVGSRQMQDIRNELRGKAQLLMGKNTMIRTALKNRIAEKGEDEALSNLLAIVNGNMGFMFCENAAGMEAAREAINKHVKPAAAKAGVIAPSSVFLPAGPTGLEPSQTSFFQALNIGTKIVKGGIELIAEFQICTANEKVSLSAQALLAKLGRKPFEYGMKVRQVFQDGAVFDAAVLDITDDIMAGKFLAGVANVAAFGRELGIPTQAALPHMMCNAFKNLVALVADVDFSFPEADEIKAILSDPEALAKMQAAAASGPAAGGAAAGGKAGAAPAAAAAVEEEEEEDVDFDLFG